MYTYAEIYFRGDGKKDFRIIAGENGNVLSNSDQGYENMVDILRAIERVTEKHPAIVTRANAQWDMENKNHHAIRSIQVVIV